MRPPVMLVRTRPRCLDFIPRQLNQPQTLTSIVWCLPGIVCTILSAAASTNKGPRVPPNATHVREFCCRLLQRWGQDAVRNRLSRPDLTGLVYRGVSSVLSRSTHHHEIADGMSYPGPSSTSSGPSFPLIHSSGGLCSQHLIHLVWSQALLRSTCHITRRKNATLGPVAFQCTEVTLFD